MSSSHGSDKSEIVKKMKYVFNIIAKDLFTKTKSD